MFGNFTKPSSPKSGLCSLENAIQFCNKAYSVSAWFLRDYYIINWFWNVKDSRYYFAISWMAVVQQLD